MRRTLALLLTAASLLAGAVQAAEPVVKVLSDRTESHLKPLFAAFTAETGVAIEAVFMDQGLVDRVAGNPSEADVLITKDAELLEIARQRGLLQPFRSQAIREGIGADFIGPESAYFVDAYRARVIFYSKARVDPAQLSTYADLAAPKWKGRLCIRSGYHDYNIALFSQMSSAYGRPAAAATIAGMHDNLAREPKGNDRAQARAIYEGQCDVALMNTYYHPIMMDNPDQRPWGEAVRVFFPDQQADGAFAMRSAIGLTKANRNPADATRLLEYFAGAAGQSLMGRITYQHPTNVHVAPDPKLATLGAEQPGISDGRFKINFVPLDAASKEREAVVQMLNEVKFDLK